MKKIIVFTILAATATLLAQHPASPAHAGETDTVHSITLPEIPPTLKDGPGKDKVITLCAICHTPDYIPMQPRLPAKTWDAEVHKMIKAFGAPINEEDAKVIINYLATEYGTGK